MGCTSSSTFATMSKSWTRLVRFIACEDNQEHYGQPKEGNVDIGLAVESDQQPAVYVIKGSSLPFDGHVDYQTVLHIQKLLSPISGEKCGGAIRCLGINFRMHAEETGIDLPNVPIMFMKGPRALAGPGVLRVPKYVTRINQLDFESELAVVVGKDCRDVAEKDVLDHILGVTSANDISARQEQLDQSQWCFGKGMDDSCPIGPVLVRASEIFNLGQIAFAGKLNDRIVQESNTSDWIFPVRKAVSFLSSGTTLAAGSIILMGTPSGVGWSRTPKVLMQDGDKFEVWHEGIGTLVNRFVFET